MNFRHESNQFMYPTVVLNTRAADFKDSYWDYFWQIMDHGRCDPKSKEEPTLLGTCF